MAFERIRRVVMGEPETGRSVFTSVEEVEPVTTGPGVSYWFVWGYDETPTLPAAISQYVPRSFFPPREGMRILVVTIPPASATAPSEDFPRDGAATMARLMEAEKAGMTPYPGPIPGMHSSDSIDIGIVVKGRVATIATDGTREILEPGDIYIQTGAPHSWETVSDEPGVIVFVVLGADRPA